MTHERKIRLAVAATLFLLPLLHPAFAPAIGPPSHLAWFLHAGSIAVLAFEFGRVAALWGLFASVVSVAIGEYTSGAGYGVPADGKTVVALTVSTGLVDLTLLALALYARGAASRYRALFDAADIALLRVDREDRVVEANAAAHELFGISDARIAGRPVRTLFGDATLFDRASAAGSLSERVTIAWGDGLRPIHADLQVVEPEGADDGHLLIRDRSLETNQREELERRGKLASLGEALAGVAHELNNPLSVIVGHAELELDGPQPLPASTREGLEVIAQQAGRMRELVAELLGFSRDRRGERARLGTVVERVLRVQRVTAGRGIELSSRIEWDGEVEAPAGQIEQVLLNLVGNALYELRRGGRGGTVGVHLDEPLGGQVELRVQDDGPGIPPDLLGSIFEPFVTTKPEGEGTGLGLAICRRLARGWGGDLSVRDSVEGGAVFTLRIPLAETTAAVT